MARQSLLERNIDERAGQMLVGTVSLAVDRAAKDIARDPLADPEFRRTPRTLVRARSRALRTPPAPRAGIPP